MSKETFVYDGVEVRKTGRKAYKEIPRIKGSPMVFTLVEITPVDDTGWLKWVKTEELFLIDKD
jgi:hypothetical protein